MERESGKKKTDQKDILIAMSSEKDRKDMRQPELERLLISLSLVGLMRSRVHLSVQAARRSRSGEESRRWRTAKCWYRALSELMICLVG